MAERRSVGFASNLEGGLWGVEETSADQKHFESLRVQILGFVSLACSKGQGIAVDLGANQCSQGEVVMAVAERGQLGSGPCMKQCSKEGVGTVAAQRGELAFGLQVNQCSEEESVMFAAEWELAGLTKNVPADSREEMDLGRVAPHQRDLLLSFSSLFSFSSMFFHPRSIHSGLAERGYRVQRLLRDPSLSSLTAHRPERFQFSQGKLCYGWLDFRKQRRTR